MSKVLMQVHKPDISLSLVAEFDWSNVDAENIQLRPIHLQILTNRNKIYKTYIFTSSHLFLDHTFPQTINHICGPFYLSVASALVGVSWYNNKSAKEIKQSTSALAKKKLDHCQNGFRDRRGIGFHLPGCIRESSTVYRQKGVIKQINYPSSAHSKLRKKIPDWVGWSELVKRSREFWSNYGCSIGVCLLFSICTQALCTFLVV